MGNGHQLPLAQCCPAHRPLCSCLAPAAAGTAPHHQLLQQAQLTLLALVQALLTQQEEPAAARKLMEDSDVKRAMEEGAQAASPLLSWCT